MSQVLKLKTRGRKTRGGAPGHLTWGADALAIEGEGEWGDPGVK